MENIEGLKYEKNIIVGVNPEYFYPPQTVLGFTLAKLPKELEQHERTISMGTQKDRSIEVGILEVGHDAAWRRIDFGKVIVGQLLYPCDISDEIRRAERKLAELPGKLERIISVIGNILEKNVVVDLASTKKEIPMMEDDLKLMANSGIAILEDFKPWTP